MAQGWISVHRQLQEHWLWEEKPFSRGQAWIDLLMSANHCDRKILLGNELIEVKAGSFITSELKLMDKWGWSKSKVRNFLDVLQSDGMIVKKSDKKKTTIIVENYSFYQDSQTTERPLEDHGQTTERPQKDTNNNDNNDNNENNTISTNGVRFKPPTVEEVMAYCQERKNSISPEAFVDYYTSKGWMIGKNKMKDWKAAVRNWESREKKKKTPAVSQSTTDLDDIL